MLFLWHKLSSKIILKVPEFKQKMSMHAVMIVEIVMKGMFISAGEFYDTDDKS